ncbi:hypothetical protein MmiEs2_02560 [Methanimicrococcus stummii]|uniref:Antitoxin SocA-like Panacea domain-containing protein n=1 Tax=Methanimicrococcus stummii TaxID=3028294 RepID=A0AA96V8Z8_9EURY|nr:type II toxin-antitoxin system antitoxin SocA domain-containing protein [Methanimicrococcus sp. Es2]WNY28076.1 hypothetical protein MmiEs2_02560 [Methanimicrococcus sp. Es2]
MNDYFDIEDVANWFLNKSSLQHKKLQKLSYYAVAWNYALLDAPLCKRDTFQAWIHGPVSPVLYDLYKNYGWTFIPQTESAADFGKSEEVLDFVWEVYKDYSQFQLENLTHSELPWEKARAGYSEFERSEEVISPEIMKDFYRKLYENSQND